EAALHVTRSNLVAEAGVADLLHGLVFREAPCELERRFRLAAYPNLEGLQAAQQEPRGIGCRDDAGAPTELAQPSRVVGRPRDDRAEQNVGVPAEELRRAVQDEVGAVLERPQ